MLSSFIKKQDLKFNDFLNIPIGQIIPGSTQPRKIFNTDSLDILSESIKQYGVLQPIIVKKTSNKKYEIVAGERRYRASKNIGLEFLPCKVIADHDINLSLVSLIENIHRSDLHFFELAASYQEILNEYSISQEQFAKLIGSSQASISNRIRLLKLSDSLRSKIIESGLSERHARVLLSAPDTLRESILDKIIKMKLNVSQAERLVSKSLVPALPQKTNITPLAIDSRITLNSIKKVVASLGALGYNVRTLHTIKPDGAIVITLEIERARSSG